MSIGSEILSSIKTSVISVNIAEHGGPLNKNGSTLPHGWLTIRKGTIASNRTIHEEGGLRSDGGNVNHQMLNTIVAKAVTANGQDIDASLYSYVDSRLIVLKNA